MRAGKYTKVTVDDNGTLTDVGYLQSVDLTGALSNYTGNIKANKIDVTNIEATGYINANTGGPDGGVILEPWNADPTNYTGVATAGMTGTEYMLISNGTNTYMSGGTGGSSTIRGGANSTTAQVEVTTSNVNISGTVVLPSTTSIGSVTSAQIGYLAGVTSAIQTQINAKAPTASPTFTGTATIPSGSSIANFTISGNTISGSAAIAITPGTGTSNLDLNSYVRMPDVYNRTSTAAGNMLIATSPLSAIFRSTASSAQWKNSVSDLDGDLDASKLLDIPIHKFKFNDDYLTETDARFGKFVPGFIAEEVAEIYPIAAEVDEEGKPSDWNSRLMLPPMLKLIQDQAKKIEELESRIVALETA